VYTIHIPYLLGHYTHECWHYELVGHLLGHTIQVYMFILEQIGIKSTSMEYITRDSITTVYITGIVDSIAVTHNTGHTN
jgi:hypothetical protein